jgi:hypothetical protein
MPREYTARWSADSIDYIRTLANSGQSGREIAARFGVTRNTIIGICHRNAIALGGRRHSGSRSEKAQANAVSPGLVLKRKEARQRTTAPVKRIDPPKPPPVEGILFDALSRTSCRWPVTDALPHKFCGAHAEGGRYCPHHTSRSVAQSSGGMA